MGLDKIKRRKRKSRLLLLLVILAGAATIRAIFAYASLVTRRKSASPQQRAEIFESGAIKQLRPKKKKHEHMWDLCPNAKTTFSNPAKLEARKRLLEIAAKKKRATFPNALISLQRGDMPVIISVPHGGAGKGKAYTWQRKHLAPRVAASTNMSDFLGRLSRVSVDTNTQQLAYEISKKLNMLTKRKPYVVTALFHRKYVDVNRRRNHTSNCCKNIWPKCTATADYDGRAMRRKRKSSRASTFSMSTTHS